jgi:ABC-type sugar transport system substrate-binding protein
VVYCESNPSDVDSFRSDFDCVSADDDTGGNLVAHHLLERGHRRFAYVGEAQRSHAYVSPSEQRLAGFRRVVNAGGGELTPEAIMTVHHDIESAAAATRALLSSEHPPTAIFAHDDLLAAGVLRAAREARIAVPESLAVVGFDDTDLAAALGLTTVRQQFEESGRLAARILTERLQRPAATHRRVVIGLELIARESTAGPAPPTAADDPAPAVDGDAPDRDARARPSDEPVPDKPASRRRGRDDAASPDPGSRSGPGPVSRRGSSASSPTEPTTPATRTSTGER